MAPGTSDRTAPACCGHHDPVCQRPLRRWPVGDRVRHDPPALHAAGITALCAPAVLDTPDQAESLCGTESSQPDANSTGDRSFSGPLVVRQNVLTIDGGSVTCGDVTDASPCVIAYITGSSTADYAVQVFSAVYIGPAPIDEVSEDVDPGGSVSTHPSDGQTTGDAQGTTVLSPNAGTVTIEEADASGPTPAGYQLIGQQVTISAPPASVADPLHMTFFLDASAVPPGETAQSIAIFRDGVRADACVDSSGAANADPCVSGRQTLSDGDIQIDVLSSHASVWNAGIVAPK